MTHSDYSTIVEFQKYILVANISFGLENVRFQEWSRRIIQKIPTVSYRSNSNFKKFQIYCPEYNPFHFIKNLSRDYSRMSIKAGAYGAIAAATSAISIYILLCLISSRTDLLDIGYILTAVKPYYWAAAGKSPL